MGITLSQNGSLDKETILRIKKTSFSFGNLQARLWSQHDIRLTTKLSIYRACVLTTLLYASETWTAYNPQIKILERFHQRCLRHILNKKWTSFIPDTEVFENSNIPSIENLIIKSQLKLSGHLVRMDDIRIPKQHFYGEISIGRRKQCKPKMRFKDRLKNNLKLSKMYVDNWEIDAVGRSQWRNKVFKGLSTFELFRTSKASFKHAIRRGEYVVPNEQNVLEPLKCETCGRPCLSLAGFKSHQRKHAARTPIIYNTVNDKICTICNKICLSAAGLKRHIKVHNPAPEVEINLNPLSYNACGRLCKSHAGL